MIIFFSFPHLHSFQAYAFAALRLTIPPRPSASSPSPRPFGYNPKLNSLFTVVPSVRRAPYVDTSPLDCAQFKPLSPDPDLCVLDFRSSSFFLPGGL